MDTILTVVPSEDKLDKKPGKVTARVNNLTYFIITGIKID